VHAVAADDDVEQLVDEVGFLFVLDGGAEVNFDFLEEGAVGTGFLEFGAGFVELSGDVDVTEGGAAFGALLIESTDGDGAMDAGGEGIDEDPVLVIGVLSFTFDIAKFHESGHGRGLS
jgi:hypothetical protein